MPIARPVSAPSDDGWARHINSQRASEFPTLVRDGTSGQRGLSTYCCLRWEIAACGGGAILDIVCVSFHSLNLNPQGKQCLGWLLTGNMLGKPGSAESSLQSLSSRPRELCDRAEGSIRLAGLAQDKPMGWARTLGKPRRGDIYIAWGVSPRNTDRQKKPSPGGATEKTFICVDLCYLRFLLRGRPSSRQIGRLIVGTESN